MLTRSIILLTAAAAAYVSSAVAVTVPTPGPVVRDVFAEAVYARQLADAAALASASSALSIYNGVGTTAFSAPTGTACAPGLQSYTTEEGLIRCCAGSIVNRHCFQDTLGLVYTADPQAVLNGETTPPVAAATTAGGVVGADTTGGVVPVVATTTARTSSLSTPFVFSSTYRPTATGGTRGVAAEETTRARSRLSQTFTPTGKPSAQTSSGASSGARAASSLRTDVCFTIAAMVSGALLAGSAIML